MVRLGGRTSTFRPVSARYTVTDSYVLPVDVDVEAVQPHAHYRARTFAARQRCRTAPPGR